MTNVNCSEEKNVLGIPIWRHIWRAIFFIFMIVLIIKVLWAVNSVFETIVVSGLIMILISLRSFSFSMRTMIFSGIGKLYKKLKEIEIKLDINPDDDEDTAVFEEEIKSFEKSYRLIMGEYGLGMRLRIIGYGLCLFRMISVLFF